jgi:hypothetical protein
LKKALRVTTFLLLIQVSPAFSQSIEFYNRFNIPSYTSLSINRGDFLFVAENSGSVLKYDWDGNKVLTYSSDRIAPISNLEAIMTSKIFIFFNDLQQYLILNRFMSLISDLHFPPDIIGFGRNATLATDNNIWVIDDNDFSLKKFSPQYSEILLVTSFDLLLDDTRYDIKDIAEYQNRLYICDAYKGILVFDNMGNYLDSISERNINKLSFYRNYLISTNGQTLNFINLYGLPGWENVVCGEGFIYLINKGEVSVYRINP